MAGAAQYKAFPQSRSCRFAGGRARREAAAIFPPVKKTATDPKKVSGGRAAGFFLQAYKRYV
jgi:hypothetical protein